MRYRLVRELAADGFDVAVTCRVLNVSRSGYYEWVNRPPSDRDVEDAYLANAIVDIHDMSRRSYGSPRVHAELRLGMGIKVGRKRVARLLRMLRLAGISHRPKRRHRPAAAVHEDLVQRKFVAEGPDRLWCTDITEHPTRSGKVYCCAVLDVFSRVVVGWSIADHMRSDLVVDALQMATWRRRPEGTIVHSDRGSQGEINRSSQHPVLEVLSGPSSAGSRSGDPTEAAVAWPSEVPAPRRGSVLGRDRQGTVADRSRSCGRRGASGRSAVVPQRWRHAAVRPEFQANGPLPVVR
jgi:hypothetical protein